MNDLQLFWRYLNCCLFFSLPVYETSKFYFSQLLFHIYFLPSHFSSSLLLFTASYHRNVVNSPSKKTKNARFHTWFSKSTFQVSKSRFLGHLNQQAMDLSWGSSATYCFLAVCSSFLYYCPCQNKCKKCPKINHIKQIKSINKTMPAFGKMEKHHKMLNNNNGIYRDIPLQRYI